MKVYSIYDSKGEVYGNPFFQKTRGVAVRTFMEAIADPNSQLNKYPGDFTMFELGDFDELTGTFELYEAKQNLGTALDYKPKVAEVVKLNKGDGI